MEERREPRGNEQPRPARKRRRRKNRVLGTLLYVAFVIGVSALLATVGWIAANDVLALNKADHTAVITLPEDVFTSREITETTEEDGEKVTTTRTVQEVDLGYVTDLLKENGIIEFKPVFRLFSVFSHAERKMAPGTYELNTDMDYRAIVTNLGSQSSSRMTTKVTIPEGFTLDQIFQRLEEAGVATVENLRQVSANYDFKFDFLQGVLPLGDYHRLEGYLFPDTYEFYMGGGESEAVQVLNRMLLRFDQQFSEEMRQTAADMGYTVHDIVIIASLIEKETDGGDQAHIASVIYNRLSHPEAETVGTLGIDAALVYALGRPITQADYTANTPYNTYTNQGLPPGPIANPGMASFRAAVEPDETSDYYYVLGSDGVHHFFRTHQQQLDYIAQMQSN